MLKEASFPSSFIRALLRDVERGKKRLAAEGGTYLSFPLRDVLDFSRNNLHSYSLLAKLKCWQAFNALLSGLGLT